jgi:hypothetical protein
MWIFHINLIFLCPSQTKSHIFRSGDLEGHNPRLVNHSTRTPFKSAIEMLAFWSMAVCFGEVPYIFRPVSQNCKNRLLASSFFLSVRPFALKNSVPTGLGFVNFDILVFFKILFRNFNFNSNLIRKNEYLTWKPVYFCDIILLISFYNCKCFGQMW